LQFSVQAAGPETFGYTLLYGSPCCVVTDVCVRFTRMSLWKMTSPYHLITYELTPWCRMLFEKLIVTQPVKKSAFLWNPKVHYRIHTGPLLDPILSQLNRLHLNVILPPTPRFF